MGLFGMSRDEAKKRYIEILTSTFPEYKYQTPISDLIANAIVDGSQQKEANSDEFSMAPTMSTVVVDT